MQYLKGVATLQFDRSRCLGCGMCLQVCPHGVFVPSEGRVAIREKDDCMECGACQKNCPHGAIRVEAGVGCAAAFIIGALTGQEPTCDCSGGKSSCC